MQQGEAFLFFPNYFGAAMDQSVKGTARPPRITVGITWSKPL